MSDCAEADEERSIAPTGSRASAWMSLRRLSVSSAMSISLQASKSWNAGCRSMTSPHEPALRHDLKIEAPHFLKCAAHQMIAVAAAAQRQGHLGVIDGHDIAFEAVVGNGQARRRIHLEPVLLGDCDEQGWPSSRPHSSVGDPPSTGSSGSRMVGSSLSGLFTRVEIGHIIISSAGNGTSRSRGSGSMLASQRS